MLNNGFKGDYSEELCILYAKFLIDTFSGFEPVSNDIRVLENLLTLLNRNKIDVNINIVSVLSVEYRNIHSMCVFYSYGRDILKTLDKFKQIDRCNKINNINKLNK